MSFILIKGYGVYGKISARKVVFKRYAKFNGIRPPFIRITGLFSIGRYFNNGCCRIFASCLHADGAIVVFIEGIWKYRLYLLGFCVCGDIPVLRLLGEQNISHASADKVGIKTGAAELFGNRRDFFRNREVHSAIVARAVLFKCALVVKWISRLTSD